MKQDKGTIEIKRSLQRKMVGRKEVAKAIALSLYVKSIVRSSTVKNFTYDKMRTLTGLGISSLRKRIDILKRLGLVSFIGKNKEHICFSSMTGSRKRTNIDISYFKYKNIKEVENSVFASLLIETLPSMRFAAPTTEEISKRLNEVGVCVGVMTMVRNMWNTEFL